MSGFDVAHACGRYAEKRSKEIADKRDATRVLSVICGDPLMRKELYQGRIIGGQFKKDVDEERAARKI